MPSQALLYPMPILTSHALCLSWPTLHIDHPIPCLFLACPLYFAPNEHTNHVHLPGKPPPFILHPTLTATLSLSAQCALPFEVLLKTFIPFVFFCALHGLICLMLVAYKGLKRKGRYARMKR